MNQLLDLATQYTSKKHMFVAMPWFSFWKIVETKYDFVKIKRRYVFFFWSHLEFFLTWACHKNKWTIDNSILACTPKKPPKMNFVNSTIILRFAQTRYVWLFGCDLFSYWHLTLKHVIYSSRTNGWAKIIGTRIGCDSKVAPYANIMNLVCHCTPYSSKCKNSLFKYNSKYCSAK